ncbi:MAG: sulfotransferase [Acidimicrobiales bacterium]
MESFFFLIGYTRSGSTLLGSLLNAHPEMVIAHEADIMRYVRPGITRNQLFAILLTRDRQFAAIGRKWSGFDYAVQGHGQGTFGRLRVIGDKHADKAAQHLHNDPGRLDRLRAVVRVPIRAVHLVRNPFDTIASIARNRELPLSSAIAIYRGFGVAVDDVLNRLDADELLEIRYETFTADTVRSLSSILGFLGVGAPGDYLNACAALVDSEGRPGRRTFEWPSTERRRVEDLIAARPVLAGYTFNG